MSTPASRRSQLSSCPVGRRQALKQWDEAACRLAEEGQLLWLVGQGLHLALSAAELSPQGVPPPPIEALRDWANRTICSLGLVRREAELRGYEVGRTALPAAGPSPSPRASDDGDGRAGSAADSVAVPVVWVASQTVRGRWVTLAVGVDLQGHKKMLSLQEGSTSDPVVTRGVLQTLATQTTPGTGLLLVTDGSRTLDAAVADLGDSGIRVAHCRWCLRQEVIAHVARDMRQDITEALDRAWQQPIEAARVSLRSLALSLRRSHPGAAERLERSLEASLQVAVLGVRPPLRDHLEVAGVVRMAIMKALKWGQSTAVGVAAVKAGLSQWQRRTNRLIGHGALPALVQALQEERGHAS